ncbi:Ankyrin repeat domain-containing protein [Tetrabaena socialis]|uniref:Ankyrin repeat domain-containing protein n=1 Tax=Tetrabaena socialis TaxID=47790 RepID=A0A2J7ZU09_9CHLO|nr:Ankyrin repeat domain-containing protein [Tetrabaena socialis]|eukprot:PNH03754.1 Ankyrin repeat domain-containing protein [Tetrabaena socialis]
MLAVHVDGRSALYLASEGGREEAVELLLEAGAEVNTKTKKRDTALKAACLNGHIGVVKLLLNAKADVNTKNESGSSALYVASEKGHTEVVELLTEAGANINTRMKLPSVSPIIRSSALYIASKNGHTGVVKLLFKAAAGAGINIEDDEGSFSAICGASENGHTGVVELLIKEGADFNMKSTGAMTIANCLHGDQHGGCFTYIDVGATGKTPDYVVSGCLLPRRG